MKGNGWKRKSYNIPKIKVEKRRFKTEINGRKIKQKEIGD